MGKLETALRDEIQRLSRKAARQVLQKTSEDVQRLKKRVAELQSEVNRLRRQQAREKSKTRMAEAVRAAPKKKSRLSPYLIRKLRKRLAVSQAELAGLLDVSTAAVGFWEAGRTSPREAMKARIVALRSLGRRDVKRILAEKAAARGKPRTAPTKRTRRAKASK